VNDLSLVGASVRRVMPVTRAGGIHSPRAVSLALVLCAFLLLALATRAAFAPASARAESFGEIGQVGVFGTGEAQFEFPIDVAVDTSENNDVFVIDSPEGFEPKEVRIQKFEPPLRQSSKPVATAKVPMEAGQYIAAIAVDPALDRLYVLKSAEGQTSSWIASEIESYSTGALSTEPVFYKFQTTPAGLPEPRGMSLEPGTNNLLVLGTGAGREHTVIQQIVGDGSTGSLGEEFIDSADVITGGSVGSNAIAAGPDGAIYVEGNAGFNPRGYPGIDELVTASHGHSLSNPEIRTVHSEDGDGEELNGEVPKLTGGAEYQFFESSQGEQLAVSPEGSAVYAATVSTPEDFSSTEGDYEVRGISPASGLQSIVYGGGPVTGPHTEECHIASEAIDIAAGMGGIVYALDKGVTKYHGPQFSTYGFHLIEFGPGGTGCPVPQTAVSAPSEAKKGESVMFTAEKAHLEGAKPSELTWEVSGPENETKTVVTVPPASEPSLEFSRRFLKPGSYTVKMTMVTTGGFGPPAPVEQKLEVTASKPSASFEVEPSVASFRPGETVTFNAAGSQDPAGGECLPTTGCKPTNEMKEYKWNFGDGSEEVTTEWPHDTVTHVFANAGSQPVQDTVTLTVVDKETGVDQQDTENTFGQELTIEGTPANNPPPPSNNNPITTPIATTPVVTPPPVSTGPPPPPPVKPLTSAQKLALALKSCHKDKSKKARAKCEKVAKAKYSPKKKMGKKGGKKK
jgi:hypothetical protein